MFENPPWEEIVSLLRDVRSIAVVGLSPNPSRPSYRVAEGLISFGYDIIPVRPRIREVLGRKAYASLMDMPASVDLVDVFRAPQHVDAIVEECIALGVPALWLQDGVVNERAALHARSSGMTVIMDRCIWRDRKRLAATQ
jgi:uncharacterized protein